jgi:RNA polymerase sigma-70 factor (ECF subfamily)
MDRMTNDELTQLYQRYGYLVHRRCAALLGNGHDAEDALQETFLRVQRYPPREVRSMHGWLLGIAVRVCFDQLERGRRAEPWPQTALRKLRELAGSGAPAQPELRLSLGGELLKLGEAAREMVILHLLDGMTQEEIAERTGYSRKWVGIQLRAAEEKLRIALGDSTPGGEPCPSP